MAYGFSTAMLAGMVCDGFITMKVETLRSDDLTIKVRNFQITELGGRSLWPQTRRRPPEP
jgi:hypothetical protein